MLLKPIEVDLEGKTFVIGKFPATVGQDIIAELASAAANAARTSEGVKLDPIRNKIMSYVGVKIDGRDAPLMLTSRALIDNHVEDIDTLFKLQQEALGHSFHFFKNEKVSAFFQDLKQIIHPKIL